MNDLITIRDELKFLDLYVNLENRRFDTKYTVEYNVDSEVLYDKKIPSFMLQPLIENIINHADYGNSDVRKIQINLAYRDGMFFIDVIDFGESTSSQKSNDNRTSYGLSILRNRIKIYNGKNYHISDLVLESTDKVTNKGKTVRIKLKEWM